VSALPPFTPPWATRIGPGQLGPFTVSDFNYSTSLLKFCAGWYLWRSYQGRRIRGWCHHRTPLSAGNRVSTPFASVVTFPGCSFPIAVPVLLPVVHVPYHLSPCSAYLLYLLTSLMPDSFLSGQQASMYSVCFTTTFLPGLTLDLSFLSAPNNLQGGLPRLHTPNRQQTLCLGGLPADANAPPLYPGVNRPPHPVPLAGTVPVMPPTIYVRENHD